MFLWEFSVSKKFRLSTPVGWNGKKSQVLEGLYHLTVYKKKKKKLKKILRKILRKSKSWLFNSSQIN